MTRRELLIAATCAPAAAAAERPTTMGLSPDCFVIARPPRTALEYLEYCHARGAGGVQAILTDFSPEYLRAVRSKAEQYGMYLEITTQLPDEDTTKFEQTLKAAKEAGAIAIRSVCLGGRRYETFSTLEQWKEFVARSKAKLARAVPIADKYRIPLGIENHKDWTIEEMAPLLQGYSSEYFGACIDWGNNIALLDDPYEVVDSLAKFAVNLSPKDMAVDEYADGFLLSEVALGDGMLDLKRMTEAVRRARPKTRFSLDMLTRNPLQVPCLIDKYWVTFPSRNGRYLARTLAMVRANKPKKPLVRVDALSKEEALKLEQENVQRSLAYARDQLGLV